MSDHTNQILCLINFAFIDGKLHSKEKAWLNSKIQSPYIPAEDRKLIQQEIRKPSGRPLKYFKEIKSLDQKHRTLDYARLIINLDKKLCPDESREFKKIQKFYLEKENETMKANKEYILKSFRATKVLDFTKPKPPTKFEKLDDFFYGGMISSFIDALTNSPSQNYTPRTLVYILFGGGEFTFRIVKFITQVLVFLALVFFILYFEFRVELI